jgi:DNA-binding transcriptional MerR regulator
VRVAELSTATGVSVPTIKYYLREGLLPQGELTSPNQARYSDEHVRRLRLIRTLMEVGGMSVARLREVLALIDTPGQDVNDMLGATQHSITSLPEFPADPDSVEQVDALIERRGWYVSDKQPAREVLAGVITRLNQLGLGWFTEVLDSYADAMETVARVDLDLTQRQQDPDAMVEVVVIGTVLGDAMMACLRRMAHEDNSWHRFGGTPKD